MNYSDVLNHLWQSTLFAAAAGVLTLALRRNSARMRYAVWLAASIKFAIPFSVLVALGKQFAWTRSTATAANTEFLPVVERFGRPFVSPIEPARFTAAHVPQIDLTSVILSAIWIIGVAFVAIHWYLLARRVRLALRAAVPFEFDAPIPVLLSPARMEPGVVGILRPVLLLPQGVIDCLTPQQLAAVVAHECCHVRRRDNLTAAFHVCIQALFWFHPLVWYIGRRLMEERERACDEEVVRMGTAPEVYVEGILNVCKTCVESPLMSVSGVTGASLKKRIEDIMTRSHSRQLDFARKVMLATAVAAAVAGPIVTGLMLVAAPQDRQQPAQVTGSKARLAFDVVSIRLNNSGTDMGTMGRSGGPGGRFEATNVMLQELIELAYGDLKVSGATADLAVSGLPGWAEADHYNIQARPEADVTLTPPVLQQMLQSMLEDRFKLKMRRETKNTPVYALVIGKDGVKMKQSADQTPLEPSGPLAGGPPPGDAPPPPEAGPGPGRPTGPPPRGRIVLGIGQLRADGRTAETLAELLTQYAERKVIDKTGLTALYDIELRWTPERLTDPALVPPGVEINTTGPDWFTAIQEQLGLRLVPETAPVDSFVVEHLEKPSDN